MNRFFTQNHYFPLWITGSFCLFWLSTCPATQSQIIRDTTLVDSTTVTSNGSTSTITGGTRAGSNLFHSFQEFSIPQGSEAFFNNDFDIQNIISRVTGGKTSTIDGILRANGTANLFLINPSGIIFGANAQLNIGGSFIATTADSLKFSDGSEFSATNPTAPPLLVVNVPIGLQFGSNPGTIINRSQANSLLPLPNPNQVGLEVLPGQTLGLIGGDVLLEGGNLRAFQGQIELGSVASSGFVSLTPTTTGLNFGYQGIETFGSIELSGTAAVNASGLGGGTIRVRGGDVSLTEGSKLVAETFGDMNGGGIDIQANQFNVRSQAYVSTSTFLGSGAGGSLTVTADDVNVEGTSPFTTSQQLLTGTFNPLNLRDGLFSLSGGSGKAGDLTINAARLHLQNGANVLTTAFLNGDGGNLTLNISELGDFSDGSLLFTGSAGAGDAGNIAITAKQLRLLEGTSISTTPGPTSSGRGGNLMLTADSVELRGTPAEATVPGGLFTTTLGTGDAGNLTIATNQLRVFNGTHISTSTAGSGRGGDL
ncbi:MAG TPA: filamentous hemagglutinin N-terminal domain-containing protein, partial [Coleofasciculaceae cyanobacterium]